MIRFVLRQFRTQVALAAVALAIVAVVAVITGIRLWNLYDSKVVDCATQNNCGVVVDQLRRSGQVVNTGLDALMLTIPAIIGVFWGAPLVSREFEAGTFRLVWTQSVSRKRWLAAKILIVGLASVAIAGLLSLMVTWWSTPLDKVNLNRFSPGVFDIRGVAPIGYAAFGFALGVASGLVTRRLLSAMALTLAVYVGVRIVVALWILPNIVAPDHLTLGLRDGTGLGFDRHVFSAETPSIPNAWAISSQIVDQSGAAATDQALKDFVQERCPGLFEGEGESSGGSGHQPVSDAVQRAFQNCVSQLDDNFQLDVAYHPADQYWPFQWYDMAMFGGASVVLLGLCFGAIGRRSA